ncbi:LytTR family DNA-binding domain-containing protein [Azospirillum sp.]|uniref:LytTR family DNA-binding domain-containing protein n=1 Tax=Azospirillum sp. TaxID=34012 RepID=UPI002D72843C|nr:LytTR family DNA-binding domain-containing protein [Azospirillum sp.]HYD64994.1 LytTR family DNA-binding domain-containing protein [Azospirillum sp.]
MTVMDMAGRPRTPYLRRLFGRRLPVLAATVAVLTVIGPFGTFADLTAAQRLAYWGGLIGLGALAFEAVSQAAFRILKRRAHAWRTILAGVALTVTALLTVCVATLEVTLRGLDYLHPLGLAEMFVYVAVITALVTAVPLWLELRDRGLVGAPPMPAVPEAVKVPVPEPAAGPVPREIPFLARIPARLGRSLVALEMEDHYVRVHTANGSDLLLMRLRDAVAELEGFDGLQVHRSYWVAAAAVTGVERKPDGKLTLVLSTGLKVPVSRSFAPAVRAAGWLERSGMGGSGTG